MEGVRAYSCACIALSFHNEGFYYSVSEVHTDLLQFVTNPGSIPLFAKFLAKSFKRITQSSIGCRDPPAQSKVFKLIILVTERIEQMDKTNKKVFDREFKIFDKDYLKIKEFAEFVGITERMLSTFITILKKYFIFFIYHIPIYHYIYLFLRLPLRVKSKISLIYSMRHDHYHNTVVQRKLYAAASAFSHWARTRPVSPSRLR